MSGDTKTNYLHVQQAMKALMADDRLSLAEFAVAMVYLGHMGADYSNAFPSTELVAWAAKCDRATVFRARKKLIDLGVLKAGAETRGRGVRIYSIHDVEYLSTMVENYQLRVEKFQSQSATGRRVRRVAECDGSQSATSGVAECDVRGRRVRPRSNHLRNQGTDQREPSLAGAIILSATQHRHADATSEVQSPPYSAAPPTPSSVAGRTLDKVRAQIINPMPVADVIAPAEVERLWAEQYRDKEATLYDRRTGKLNFVGNAGAELWEECKRLFLSIRDEHLDAVLGRAAIDCWDQFKSSVRSDSERQIAVKKAARGLSIEIQRGQSSAGNRGDGISKLTSV